MYRSALKKLEGVWTGTETITDTEGEQSYEATARLVFQTVFDGRFLTCDYIQTVPERPNAVAHGVFRRDDRTDALTVTWFRSPAPTATQQADAVSESDKLEFIETVDGRTTRMNYIVAMDKLTIRTDLSLPNGEWKTIVEGVYKRR